MFSYGFKFNSYNCSHFHNSVPFHGSFLQGYNTVFHKEAVSVSYSFAHDMILCSTCALSLCLPLSLSSIISLAAESIDFIV